MTRLERLKTNVVRLLNLVLCSCFGLAPTGHVVVPITQHSGKLHMAGCTDAGTACVQGRHLMWGWLQERRKAGSYDYSGCMTCSRLLYIQENRLIQVPVPELRELRSGRRWAAKGLEVDCREPYPLEGVTSPALDIEVVLQRCALPCETSFRAWADAPSCGVVRDGTTWQEQASGCLC